MRGNASGALPLVLLYHLKKYCYEMTAGPDRDIGIGTCHDE
ncbi:hypothetical protein C900_02158 [Fulvivirga imtechensis AK7]|uniref:Uncharacterized protein n=1 Tax=Fulvivirga imtechensis AK7 TaxID=1237149 RepID=L8JWC5_9BACT|nr:hypothetical protein C900_02158 [Fulvivirga imtechensis AK7]